MAYLLIYDLNGRSTERGKISRYLRKHAEAVQRSVWRFKNYEKMSTAVEHILAMGGKVLVFIESDRIVFDAQEIRRFLEVF